MEEAFLPTGGIDIAHFYVLAEDCNDIDHLLDILFFEVEDGSDFILSIEVKGGSNHRKTSASVNLIQGAVVIADGKEYTKEDIEKLFVQWFDAAHLEVVEKTKRVFLDNMTNDDSVVSVLKEDFIHLSALGLVAFLPSVYKKHMERLANLEKAYKFSPCFPSNMKVGDKVKLEVVLRKRNYYETNFSYYGGTNACYQFSDEHGYCFLWRTAPKPLLEEIDLDKEIKVLLSGTVKEFSEYKRTKQTVLTRCKVEAV